MIPVPLDQIGHLLRGHAAPVDPGQVLAVEHLRGQGRRRAARLEERVVKMQHGARDLRIRCRQLARLRLGRDVSFEDRIPEHLHEGCRQLCVLAFGEGLHVEAGELREPDEEVRAEGTAVVLDEIEVAGGDAQALRHGGLREPLAQPQRAYALTEVLDRSHRDILPHFTFYNNN